MAKEDKRDGGVIGGTVKRIVWLSEREGVGRLEGVLVGGPEGQSRD